MKSRRRIASLKGRGPSECVDGNKQLQQGFTTGEMGLEVSLHGSNSEPLMSALCQKQTFVGLIQSGVKMKRTSDLAIDNQFKLCRLQHLSYMFATKRIRRK
jgi:hypothetical protein